MRTKRYAVIAFTILLIALSPRRLAAQTPYPTGIAVTANTNALSIDSAIEVQASGVPANDLVEYYVYIPKNSSHPAGWHEFPYTSLTVAWLDLLRTEVHAAEFPPGDYEFAACGVSSGGQCVYSNTYSLVVPSGALGGQYNPRYNPPFSGDMQRNNDLCETSNSCDSGAQPMNGCLMRFHVYSGDQPNGSLALYQNLNVNFSAPNPGDNTGFTQLIIEHEQNSFTPIFYELSNDVTYCVGNAHNTSGAPVTNVSPSNPAANCAFANPEPADGLSHVIWGQIANSPGECLDANFPCLEIFYDGSEFARERMQNRGDLVASYGQMEALSNNQDNVWASQLNYTDYSFENNPGSLQVPFYVHQVYDDLEWQDTSYNWNFLWWNDSDSENEVIFHTLNGTDYRTSDVYCGPFGRLFYPDPGTTLDYVSSGDWGTINGRCPF